MVRFPKESQEFNKGGLLVEKVMLMVRSDQRIFVDYPMVRIGSDSYNLRYYELVTMKDGETNESSRSCFAHD